MFDNRLISNRHIHDYKERSRPKIIDVADKGQLKGKATGFLHCTIEENNEHQLPVRMQGLVVPGLGRNSISPQSLL